MTIEEQIKDAICNAKSIVITSHKSPDGDSIGSSLGLYRYVKALGYSAEICHPDASPNFLDWVKRDARIMEFDSDSNLVEEKMKSADLIFCLDYNHPSRLGKEMGEVLSSVPAKKIVIDHHLDPDDFGDLMISKPEICSTSQLVAQMIIDLEGSSFLSPVIAEPLYLGMVTDTGAFRFPSVDKQTHAIASIMIANGLNHSEVHENTFDGNRLEKIQLRSHILAERLEIIKEHNVAIISASNEVLKRFNYVKGDTEGLVNQALAIEGVKAAVFFTEKEDGVKISFRAKGDYEVNVLAGDHFSGGGHKYASGGFSEETLEETIKRFKQVIPDYFK